MSLIHRRRAEFLASSRQQNVHVFFDAYCKLIQAIERGKRISLVDRQWIKFDGYTLHLEDDPFVVLLVGKGDGFVKDRSVHRMRHLRDNVASICQLVFIAQMLKSQRWRYKWSFDGFRFILRLKRGPLILYIDDKMRVMDEEKDIKFTGTVESVAVWISNYA